MKRYILSLVLAGLSLSAVFALAPKSESQVPGYPGAKVVSEKQSPSKAELASGGAPDFAYGLERTWSSAATVEQVAQFYASKLGAAVGQEGGADANDLEPGQLSSVGSGYEYWDADLIDQSPDPVKAAFEKRALLADAEGWLRVVTFSWAYKTADNDPYNLSVTITDKSVSEEEPPRYSQATEITLAVAMFSREKMEAFQAKMMQDAAQQGGQVDMQQIQAQAAAQAKAAEAANKEAEARAAEENARTQAIFGKAPTEKDLGVAVYPGSRYSPEQSMFQSAFMPGETRVFIFEAPAKPDALIQFYEKRTGNKRAGTPAMIIIPINFGKAAQAGDTPPMKDYVTIAGPTETGTSVLMFFKRPAGWTGQEGAGK